MLSTIKPSSEVGASAPVDGDNGRARYKAKKVDYAGEAEKVIAEAKSSFKANPDAAIASLLVMEKKARLGLDPRTVEKCAITVLELLASSKRYDALNQNIQILCKRRQQSESVQTAIITFVTNEVLPQIKSDKEKESVIECLREMSKGKMAVEVVRANLTKMLSQMYEKKGENKKACELMQDETPETYASMERKAKLSFLLEQIRLCLKIKDFVRAELLQKKVDRKKLEDYDDLKIEFHGLLLDFYEEKKDAFELAKSHLALFSTARYQREDRLWRQSIRDIAVLLAASAYDNAQQDLIHKFLLNEKFDKVKRDEIQVYKTFLTHFINSEVLQWPVPEEKTLSLQDGWIKKQLFQRVVEHDVRVVSKYYTSVYLSELSKMLGVSENEAEETVSRMVSDQGLIARIDRPEGIISFEKSQTVDETMTSYTNNIEELLDLVEKTCHLIHKEKMMHSSS